MKRETYNVKIICPSCGEEGRMTAEENENPVLDPLNREIISVSGKFRVEGNKVVCENCGADVT